LIAVIPFDADSPWLNAEHEVGANGLSYRGYAQAIYDLEEGLRPHMWLAAWVRAHPVRIIPLKRFDFKIRGVGTTLGYFLGDGQHAPACDPAPTILLDVVSQPFEEVLSTYIHELGHFYQFETPRVDRFAADAFARCGAHCLPGRGRWVGNSWELWAEAFSVWHMAPRALMSDPIAYKMIADALTPRRAA
jgi:hypothetical protein